MMFIRKKFLINKNFQIKFIIFISIVAITTLLSTYLVLHSFFNEFKLLSDQAGLATNHPFRELLSYQQGKMNIFFIILAFVNFCIIFIFGIWMSHRIAGPIYRIVKTLEDKTSSSKEIKIRPKDFFQELPKAINEVLNNSKKT